MQAVLTAFETTETVYQDGIPSMAWLELIVLEVVVT